jgi:hypothetical protein
MSKIITERTKADDPQGGVWAYSDGNDGVRIYISPKGLTKIEASNSRHASPVQMLAWVTELTNAADAEWRKLRQELDV